MSALPSIPSMPTMPQFNAGANMPSFNFSTPSVNTTNPSYGDVYKLLSTPPPSMTNSYLPYLQNIFKQQNSFLKPQAQAIQYGGQQAVAGAQSGAMQRGLTGSSIEASNVANANYGTQSQLATLYGNQATSQSQQMAQAIMQSMGLDIQSNQAMYQNIAQAMSQQIGQNQQAGEFQQQLSQNARLAHQSQNYGMLGAGIGLTGSLLGGLGV